MNKNPKVLKKSIHVKVKPDIFEKFEEFVGKGNVSKTIRGFLEKTIKQEQKERLI